jgi:hypothetical protein
MNKNTVHLLEPSLDPAGTVRKFPNNEAGYLKSSSVPDNYA